MLFAEKQIIHQYQLYMPFFLYSMRNFSLFCNWAQSTMCVGRVAGSLRNGGF